MEELSKVYQKLTGVDIEEQYTLWNERGKGYYGEFLVFKELYRELDGCCKFLMNLQVPTPSGKITEIDFLLIHETGVYVFEIKHYKGTIYGKTSDNQWTQYFRTTNNAHFPSPVKQNKYHVDAIRNILPDIPIRSFVVFTSEDCVIKVDNNTDSLVDDTNNVVVCHLRELVEAFSDESQQARILDMEKIDNIFKALVEYSPIMKENIANDGQEIPFYEYVNHINGDFKMQVDALSADFEQRIKCNKMRLAKVILICVAITIMLILCAVGVISINNKKTEEYIKSTEVRVQSFLDKFEVVEAYNGGDISVTENLVTVSDVVLNPSVDLENTTLLSAKFTWGGDKYGLHFDRESVLIVKMKDGTLKQYGLFDTKSDAQKRRGVLLGKSPLYSERAEIKDFELFGTNIEDVAYIKLSNVKIWTYNNGRTKNIVTDYEIELYSNNA